MTSSEPGNVLPEQPVIQTMTPNVGAHATMPEARVAREVLSYEQEGASYGQERHAPTHDIPSNEQSTSVGDGLRPSPTATQSDLKSNPIDPFSSRTRRSSLPAQALMLGIVGYQKYLSPFKGAPSCRFVPSCSSYALEAVRVHGAAKGTVLAAIRVLKCQPLHPGGFDPVPEPGMWKNKPRVS